MATNHQSPHELLPALSTKQVNTTTWGTGGNTCTISDSNIHPNSQVDTWVTGTVPQAGHWAYTITQGQVVITSSDAESSTLAVSYLVF